jgi:hypothetical protein
MGINAKKDYQNQLEPQGQLILYKPAVLFLLIFLALKNISISLHTARF